MNNELKPFKNIAAAKAYCTRGMSADPRMIWEIEGRAAKLDGSPREPYAT